MLEGIPIPPIDRKFYADQENGVSFEIEQSKFRDIDRFLHYGKFALFWDQITKWAGMSYLSHTETLDFSSGSIESVFGSDPNGFLGSGSGSVWIFPYD